jgi:peptidoglycan/xylan/chitin deacetylase (PgdA/CDA1 family)
MPRRAVAVALLAVSALVFNGCDGSGAPSTVSAWRTPAPRTADGQPGGKGGGGQPGTGASPGGPGTPAGRPSGPPRPPRGGAGPAGSTRVTGSAAIGLTFDDGPDPSTTPQMLDLLKRYGVKATFCLVGFKARDNKALVQRIAAEGHTLCNHSWQHLLDLAKRPPDYIQWDLTQTNKAIHDAVPGAPIRYFRAPGGNFTPGLVQLARQYGMTSIYWDVDPRDWERTAYGTGPTMVNHVVTVVERQTRPGSIVLSHDTKPDTVTAYRTLLPWLKGRFTLVALPT